MENNKKEPLLTLALDELGELKSINSIDENSKGYKCKYRCPKCNELLNARLGKGKEKGGRQPHFAHRPGINCHGAYMTALHMLAEQIITEEKAVMAPEYKEINPQCLLFKEVEGGVRNDRKDLQPDRVGITEDNKRWCIEIRNTHEVDEVKAAKYKESNLTCLEIDVRKQSLDKEALKKFLLESPEDREWINNPNYDEQIADAERKKVAEIVKQFEEKHELEIPPNNINLKEVSTSISEDGFYAKVQAVSEDGIPYIFHIGNQNELLKVKPQRVCHELKVDTALYHSNKESLVLCMGWLYCHVPKKKQEERYEDYINNPQYEIRPSEDCRCVCSYRTIFGDCVYKKKTFEKNGAEYVVCEKEKRLKDEEKQNRIRKAKAAYNRLQTNQSPAFLKEYYHMIMKTKIYGIENNEYNTVILCELVGNHIIVLYKKATPVYQYSIDFVDDQLNTKKVADFVNLDAAKNGFYERLGYMRNSNLP